MSRRKGRILAFQALYAWDVSKIEVSDLLDFNWLEQDRINKLGAEGILFPRLLISGAIENIEEIDAKIKLFLNNWDFDRLSKVELAILRLSVYSLLFQKDVHPSIVIDEAIDIARDYGGDESYKFINGILDSIYKDQEGKTKK